MSNGSAFTLGSTQGILRELKTEIGACPAFNASTGGTHPKIEHFVGLWDTGASGSAISKSIVDKLGLKPVGQSKSYHANGMSIVNVYYINIFLPNQVGFQFIQVTEGKLEGFDMLIGMDIITMGDFSITNVGGKTMFSFRVPSIKSIDYTVEESDIKVIPPTIPTVGRNSPCPCNSGKKYKACHGK
nr:SEC-C metal-binding domain-containing protein [uncultured Pedobacter sp.]